MAEQSRVLTTGFPILVSLRKKIQLSVRALLLPFKAETIF